MATSSTFLERTPPPELYRLAQSLARWRTRPRHGRRIPEALWRAAAGLARIYGVSRVAAALRLSYRDLQRRARARRGAGSPPPAQPAFIQLPVPTAVAGREQLGTVEVVHGSGARLILRLPQAQPQELLPLVRLFLHHRP